MSCLPRTQYRSSVWKGYPWSNNNAWLAWSRRKLNIQIPLPNSWLLMRYSTPPINPRFSRYSGIKGSIHISPKGPVIRDFNLLPVEGGVSLHRNQKPRLAFSFNRHAKQWQISDRQAVSPKRSALRPAIPANGHLHLVELDFPIRIGRVATGYEPLLELKFGRARVCLSIFPERKNYSRRNT